MLFNGKIFYVYILPFILNGSTSRVWYHQNKYDLYGRYRKKIFLKNDQWPNYYRKIYFTNAFLWENFQRYLFLCSERNYFALFYTNFIKVYISKEGLRHLCFPIEKIIHYLILCQKHKYFTSFYILNKTFNNRLQFIG